LAATSSAVKWPITGEPGPEGTGTGGPLCIRTFVKARRYKGSPAYASPRTRQDDFANLTAEHLQREAVLNGGILVQFFAHHQLPQGLARGDHPGVLGFGDLEAFRFGSDHRRDQ
jgi:hypothetical protein